MERKKHTSRCVSLCNSSKIIFFHSFDSFYFLKPFLRIWNRIIIALFFVTRRKENYGRTENRKQIKRQSVEHCWSEQPTISSSENFSFIFFFLFWLLPIFPFCAYSFSTLSMRCVWPLHCLRPNRIEIVFVLLLSNKIEMWKYRKRERKEHEKRK